MSMMLGFNTILTSLLVVLFLLVCVLLILVVLIQRPSGGGLSGAFGSGAGSGQTAFGAKTGDALTYATVGIFIFFLLMAIGLNYAARPPKVTVIPAATSAPGGEAPATTTEPDVTSGVPTESVPATGTEPPATTTEPPAAPEPVTADPITPAPVTPDPAPANPPPT